MKIQINFVCFKKIRSVFNENTYQFCVFKEIRYAFNENTNQFCLFKKIKSVFNENTNQFLIQKIRFEKFKLVFNLKRSLLISRF